MRSEPHRTFCSTFWKICIFKSFPEFIHMTKLVLLIISVLFIVLVSGCTQNSNKINVTIDSLEYHWGNALNPNSLDESQYFHYFIINLKNNGERVITEQENSLRICGKSLALDQSFYSCGSDYGLLRITLVQDRNFL